MIQNVEFMMILTNHQYLNYLVSSLFVLIRNNTFIKRIIKNISHLYLILTLTTLLPMLPVTLSRERCARYLTWRLVLESMVWNMFIHREACSQWKLFCPASSGKSLVLVVRGNPRVLLTALFHSIMSLSAWGVLVPMTSTHIKMHSMIVRDDF